MAAQAHGGKTAVLIILIGVPLLLAAAGLALKSGALSKLRRPRQREGMTVVERWKSGAQRVLTRDWSESGVAMEELCFYGSKGEELGCGQKREGSPWNGTFCEWHQDLMPDSDTPALKQISIYRDGKRDGTWRTFNVDGSPAVEIVYRGDQFLTRKIFGRFGNQFLSAPERLPAGSLPAAPLPTPPPPEKAAPAK